MRISEEQRRQRGKREARVACEGRIPKKLVLRARLAFASVRQNYAKKLTPVLQAMILVTNLLVTQSKRYEDFIVLLGFLKLLKRVSKQLGFCTVY